MADEESMLAKLGELYAQLEAVRASRAAASATVSAPAENARTATSHSADGASSSAGVRASPDAARDSVGRLVFVTYALPYVIVRSGSGSGATPDALIPAASTSEWVLQEVADTVDDHAIAAIHGVHQATPDSLWIAAVPLPLEGVDAATLSSFRTQLHAKRIAPVFLDFQKAQLHMNGYCRSVLWPILHSTAPSSAYSVQAHESCGEVSTAEWAAGVPMTEELMYAAYDHVCQLFADMARDVAGPNDMLFVHDYELMLVPGKIRAMVAHATIGYFHHLPFVTSELYRILASRQHLLRGVLGADVLGFHTQDYARHFVSSCVRILGLEATPRGINYASRYVRLVISSIGIDPSPFTTLLRQKSVKKRVAELARQFEGRKVIVSVDAMDAIKGLGCKLVMLEQLLSDHSELRDKVVLIQVTVPAPKALLADTTEKEQSSVMEMVGRINGLYEQLSDSKGYTGGPVLYFPAKLPRQDVAAMYAIADVCLVTSVRDGMHLVPHEYITCRQLMKKPATVLVSEFAGSAQLLSGAFMINPFDVDGSCNVLLHALQLPQKQKMARHERLWAHVSQHTAFSWCKQFTRELQLVQRESIHLAPPAHHASKVSRDAITSSFTDAQHRVLVVDLDAVVCDADAGAVPGSAAAVAASTRGSGSPHKGGAEEAAAMFAAATLTSPRSVSAMTLNALRRLAVDVHTTVVVLSSWSCERVDACVGDMPCVRVAENGAFLRWAPECEWERELPRFTKEWMPQIMPVFSYFTERTPGSQVMVLDTCIRWSYADAAHDYGVYQARDLAATLAEFASMLPVVVVMSEAEHIVEMRPPGVNKGVLLDRLLRRLNAYRQLHGCHPDAAQQQVPSLSFTADFMAPFQAQLAALPAHMLAELEEAHAARLRGDDADSSVSILSHPTFVSVCDAMRAVYARVFKDQPIDCVVLLCMGSDRSDEDMITALDLQPRIDPNFVLAHLSGATTFTQPVQGVPQYGNAETASVASSDAATAAQLLPGSKFPTLRPLDTYAATGGPSMLSLASASTSAESPPHGGLFAVPPALRVPTQPAPTQPAPLHGVASRSERFGLLADMNSGGSPRHLLPSALSQAGGVADASGSGSGGAAGVSVLDPAGRMRMRFATSSSSSASMPWTLPSVREAASDADAAAEAAAFEGEEEGEEEGGEAGGAAADRAQAADRPRRASVTNVLSQVASSAMSLLSKAWGASSAGRGGEGGARASAAGRTRVQRGVPPEEGSTDTAPHESGVGGSSASSGDARRHRYATRLASTSEVFGLLPTLDGGETEEAVVAASRDVSARGDKLVLAGVPLVVRTRNASAGEVAPSGSGSGSGEGGVHAMRNTTYRQRGRSGVFGILDIGTTLGEDGSLQQVTSPLPLAPALPRQTPLAALAGRVAAESNGSGSGSGGEAAVHTALPLPSLPIPTSTVSTGTVHINSSRSAAGDDAESVSTTGGASGMSGSAAASLVAGAVGAHHGRASSVVPHTLPSGDTMWQVASEPMLLRSDSLHRVATTAGVRASNSVPTSMELAGGGGGGTLSMPPLETSDLLVPPSSAPTLDADEKQRAEARGQPSPSAHGKEAAGMSLPQPHPQQQQQQLRLVTADGGGVSEESSHDLAPPNELQFSFDLAALATIPIHSVMRVSEAARSTRARWVAASAHDLQHLLWQLESALDMSGTAAA